MVRREEEIVMKKRSIVQHDATIRLCVALINRKFTSPYTESGPWTQIVYRLNVNGDEVAQGGEK